MAKKECRLHSLAVMLHDLASRVSLDIGCFGSEISTANLDKIGIGGICVTGPYATADCS